MQQGSGGKKSARRKRHKSADNNNGVPHDVQNKKVIITDANGQMFAANVTTSNSFELLQNNSTEVQSLPKATTSKNGADKSVPAPNKSTRVPRIFVREKDKKKLLTHLSSLNIAGYSIKPAEKGINIFAGSVENHVKITESFKTAKTEFFSHDRADQKFFRVVLYGLDEMTPEALKADLAQIQVAPEEIKIIRPKNSRITGQVNYLLYFKPNTVYIGDLRKIKVVNYTVVEWDTFRSSKGQTTQCRRCQNYGHGTRNCHFQPRCVNCAGEHMSAECEELNKAMAAAKIKNDELQKNHMGEGEQENDLINFDFQWKCANCGLPHRANDGSCTSKRDFVNSRRIISIKQRRQQPEYRHQIENFPTLGKPVKPQIVNGIAFNKVVRNSNLNANPNPKMNFDFTATQGKSNLNNDLFSYQEIIALTQEMLSGLSSCKSKFEQFAVIAALSAKYLIDGSK